MPVLFVISEGQRQIVNYRVMKDTMVVDHAVDRAILISGVGWRQKKITIKPGWMRCRRRKFSCWFCLACHSSLRAEPSGPNPVDDEGLHQLTTADPAMATSIMADFGNELSAFVPKGSSVVVVADPPTCSPKRWGKSLTAHGYQLKKSPGLVQDQSSLRS